MMHLQGGVKIKISDGDQSAIVSDYRAGQTPSAIGRRLSVGRKTICRVLNNHGVSVESPYAHSSISSATKADIANAYRSGETYDSITIRFGCCKDTINKILKLAGIEARKPHEFKRMYALDECAFDVITEESAYWIGFLMADGALGLNNHSICLGLQERDLQHVEKFSKFLRTDNPIRRYDMSYKHAGEVRSRPSVRLSISSALLRSRLADFGVTSRKSLTANVKLVQNDRNFWRGLCDGDGHLGILFLKGYCGRRSSISPCLQLIGSSQILWQFTKFIRASLPMGDSRYFEPQLKHKDRPDGAWECRFHGPCALRVIKLLYAGCNVSLERKRRLAQTILSIASTYDRWKSAL